MEEKDKIAEALNGIRVEFTGAGCGLWVLAIATTFVAVALWRIGDRI